MNLSLYYWKKTEIKKKKKHRKQSTVKTYFELVCERVQKKQKNTEKNKTKNIKSKFLLLNWSQKGPNGRKVQPTEGGREERVGQSGRSEGRERGRLSCAMSKKAPMLCRTVSIV